MLLRVMRRLSGRSEQRACERAAQAAAAIRVDVVVLARRARTARLEMAAFLLDMAALELDRAAIESARHDAPRAGPATGVAAAPAAAPSGPEERGKQPG